MNHEIFHETGGVGMGSWIQPTCSCGWEGIKQYAYNDWQHTNLADDVEIHLKETSCKSVTTLSPS